MTQRIRLLALVLLLLTSATAFTQRIPGRPMPMPRAPRVPPQPTPQPGQPSPAPGVYASTVKLVGGPTYKQNAKVDVIGTLTWNGNPSVGYMVTTWTFPTTVTAVKFSSIGGSFFGYHPNIGAGVNDPVAIGLKVEFFTTSGGQVGSTHNTTFTRVP